MRLAAAVVFSVVTLSASAQDVRGTFTLSAASMRSTGDNSVLENTPLGDVDLEVESAFGVSGAAGIMVGRRFAAELAIAHLQPDLTVRAAGFGLNLGSIEVVPLTLTAQYHHDTGSGFHPYIGAGIAYVWFGEIEEGAFDLVEDDTSLDPAVGGVIEAGLVARLSPRVSLTGSAKYFPVESAIEDSNSFPVEVDLNPLMLSIGVRWTTR